MPLLDLAVGRDPNTGPERDCFLRQVRVKSGGPHAVADGPASSMDAVGGHRLVVHLPTLAGSMIVCLYG
ncbi:hypothetical protein [Streptomyces sp. ADI95-17]|uniref:hypothetical protein n=1 Tax=Streptomyces sp. ADI95-17 TaxID=1522759 RepID=UPI001F14B21D|nr:hypothetical protein [Streptomyces sp. ADI95-17]